MTNTKVVAFSVLGLWGFIKREFLFLNSETQNFQVFQRWSLAEIF